MPLSPHALTTVDQIRVLLSGRDEIPAEHDPLLELIINGVSNTVERICVRAHSHATDPPARRHFELATYTNERYIAPGGQYLRLAQAPLVAVASLADAGTVIDPDSYEVLAEMGAVYREAGWGSSAIVGGFLSAGVIHSRRRKATLTATYTAGYVLPKDHSDVTPRTLPEDLEFAVIEACAAAYKLRDKAGLASETFEGLTLQFERWPEHVRDVVLRYATGAVL